MAMRTTSSRVPFVCSLFPRVVRGERTDFGSDLVRERCGGEGRREGGKGTRRAHHDPKIIARARELRKRQAEAESLLRYVLRGRPLCSLKFRRRYPIELFVVDFPCVEERWIVEIDGGHPEQVYADDLTRKQRLEASGWKVLQFGREDVLDDVEAVALSIARFLNREPTFRGNTPTQRREPPYSHPGLRKRRGA
jgi:very-short-patch-repair endonuclease